MSKPLFFQKPFKYSYVRATLILFFVNVAIFVFGMFNPELDRYIKTYGSLNCSYVLYKHAFWQFFTYMFLHGNLEHLFFNMFGLLMFGITLEKTIGSKEFVLMYFVCGVFTGILSFLVYWATGQYRVFMLGASGAIYSILFAYAVFYPKSIIYIWGIIPLPAPVLVLVYALIETFDQLFGRGAGVAHLAHLFGFLTAWLYFLIRMGISPLKIWKRS